MKEGKVAIWVDKETGLPVIIPVSRKDQMEWMESEVRKTSQVVINISVRDWQIIGQSTNSYLSFVS